MVPKVTTARRGRSKPCVVGFCDIQAWGEVLVEHVDGDNWERKARNAYINNAGNVHTYNVTLRHVRATVVVVGEQ